MTTLASQRRQRTRSSFDFALWGRWIRANALAEMIGLTGSLLATGVIIGAIGDASPLTVIAAAVAAVLFGIFFEGVVVGWFQWRVLRDVFSTMTRGSWIRATAIGAGIAWTLGMLPSTIMSIVAVGEPAGGIARVAVDLDAVGLEVLDPVVLDAGLGVVTELDAGVLLVGRFAHLHENDGWEPEVLRRPHGDGQPQDVRVRGRVGVQA